MSDFDVSIRPITVEDTEKIVFWRNTPDVQNNFIYRTPFTSEAHLNWFKNRVQTGEVAQFMIHSEKLGRDVGSVYLRDIDCENQKAEFGIFIGEADARGQGIGSKATMLTLQYGFEKLNLNRIFLRVFARNIGAVKAYKKAGFIQEGLFREDVIIDGIKEDMIFMSVLKAEYMENK